MAKVGHFAEGWQKQQKKSVSERMHERNQKSRLKDLQQSKVMKHLTKMAQKTSRPHSAQKSGPLVKPGKDIPQTVQRNRGETQDQAARQQNLASKRFVKVKQDAQNLKSLQNKAPQSSSRTATPKAINQKGRTIQPDLKQAPQQLGSARLAQAATRTAQEQAARQNAAKTARYAAKAPKQGAKEARPTDRIHTQPQAKDASQARQTAQASAKAGQPAPAKDGGSRVARSKSGEGKKKAEKQKTSRSTKGPGGAGRSGASDRLGALMSGLGGGEQDHDAHERAHEIADLKRTAPSERLPETDPSFHVYSEFDTAKPGAEFGKGKAQLLAKVTKERLIEIAEFDKELDKFIAKGLSERVIGPLKDEIKAADFLCSVNGGLIG